MHSCFVHSLSTLRVDPREATLLTDVQATVHMTRGMKDQDVVSIAAETAKTPAQAIAAFCIIYMRVAASNLSVLQAGDEKGHISLLTNCLVTRLAFASNANLPLFLDRMYAAYD